MIGRRSEEEIGTMQSGKIYRINTRKRSRGQDLKNFIEDGYIPLLRKSKSEEICMVFIVLRYSIV